MILSCDPGDITGWVIWDDEGHDLYRGQLPSDEFIDRLADGVFQNLKIIVCEDYRLFRGRAQAQTGSKFKAVQVIGALKVLAKQTKAKIVLQQTGHRDLGYKFSGTSQPKNHSQSHWADARAHGYYYLVKNGIRKTEQESARLGTS